MQGAGKLKGFFYLFLNQLSTIKEIFTETKQEEGWRKREREAEEEGKYGSSVPNKYQTQGKVELYVL